jgi:sialidase-1
MKKTRRAFALSSLGIGAAYASNSNLGRSRGDQQGAVRLQEDPRLSCFEVNLAKGFGSDLVATFVRAASGSETGEILLVRSADGGLTWSKPVSVFSVEEQGKLGAGYQPAGVTLLSDGSLITSTTRFSFLFEGRIAWRKDSEIEGVYTSKSTDGGHRWDDARKLDFAPFGVAWTRGSTVEMPDGSLLLPLAGQTGDQYQRSGESVASFLMRSVDGGTTWSYHATIARDSNRFHDFDEPALLSLGGQRVLCVLGKREGAVQNWQGGYLHVTMSHDGGITWSKPQATSMWGHPAHLLRMRDGRVLCTYGYRMHPNPGVKGCVSADGSMWRPEDIFSVKEVASLDSDSRQIGCPSSVQMDDERIFTAYQLWSETNLEGVPAGAALKRHRLEGRLYRV